MGITRALVSVAGGLLLLFNMNKFLAVLCLAAAVAAEADPYILGYGGYGGYGLGYSGLQGLGYAGIGGYGGYGYASPVHHGYNHVANTQVSPSASLSIAGAAPAAVPGVVGARTYAGAGRYVANSAGTVHVAKREADPYYAGYNGLGYAGYGGYATPVVQAVTPVHNVAAVQAVTPVHNVAAVKAVSPVHNVAAVNNVAHIHNIATFHAATPVHNVAAVHNVAPVHHVAAVQSATPVHHVAAVQNVAAVHAAAPIHNVAAVHAATPVHAVAGINAVAPVNHIAGVHHGYNNANTQVSPSASLSIAGAAPAAVPGVVGARTYAGAGRYVANSAGTVHVAK